MHHGIPLLILRVTSEIIAQHSKVRLQQLLPSRVAQSRRRMERGHNHKMTHLMEPAAKLGNTYLRLQHKMRCRITQRNDDVRPDAANLLAQKRGTGQHFVGLGITICRRAALKNVGDIDILSRKPG